jgi:hypothetical protein
MKFINLKKQLERSGDDESFAHTKDGAVSLFCADCDFYKESDKDLECGAFKLLRLLIDKKVLTLAQISDAIGK